MCSIWASWYVHCPVLVDRISPLCLTFTTPAGTDFPFARVADSSVPPSPRPCQLAAMKFCVATESLCCEGRQMPVHSQELLDAPHAPSPSPGKRKGTLFRGAF
ncbi:vitronectin [Platysternon megacephalum]|uniref:Vitronectin n=1 Tax=Platysternon megacephalum TaxID=55544 RepID=A0A4D9E406_9SAUR|nr:vitronectin [Platysternon megacephalum]